jgi:hypothetical protein
VKDHDFIKNKKTNEFEVTMTKKHQFQILMEYLDLYHRKIAKMQSGYISLTPHVID